VVVTVVSYVSPDRYAATAVGAVFLAATWWLVLRRDEHTIRAFALSLGGLLEPTPVDAKRIARDAAQAIGWALLLCLITFPPFAIGYPMWHGSRHDFVLRGPASLLDEVAGQLLVIALPEEAFFRGYLQTALDRAWPPRWRILGATLGVAWIVSAAIFAVGHLLTTPRQPARLAVFFPALLFGWLRARTGGVGAGVAYHAACNMFSATLGRGFGLGG
jgi:membrane protease YdiL (CAAX protease family)